MNKNSSNRVDKYVSLLILSLILVGGGLIGCSSGTKNSEGQYAGGSDAYHAHTNLGMPKNSSAASSEQANAENNVIKNMRQITFDGPRAGEGYFSPDGELMIFQSERDAENPFYQMYVKNFKSNTVTRVSPGLGKTTCGWIAPDKTWVIYASTHLDPKAKDKQIAELNERKSGVKKRYSWDFDENYDIFRATIDGKQIQNLTRTKGYNAEGSISPNGKYIAFASNRLAYSQELSAKDKEMLAKDPSYFLDIYIMDVDGSNVRQLTHSAGYDGGPFFSPDGSRIVWRRFTADGRTAEIFSMNIDGTDEKQLTKLHAMSWAPFYHPSGDYIVFTTSILGHHNFELYVVDAQAKQAPIRVSFLPGFDGLPVFTPDGQKISWSRKLSETDSQIVMADWDDAKIRQKLKLPAITPRTSMMTASITLSDLKSTVRYLSSKTFAGRATGSAGEELMSEFVRNYFNDIGLVPLNKNALPDRNEKEFQQKFNFLKDAKLGSGNELIAHPTKQTLALDKIWRPLAFSRNGEFATAPVVFAGYGIRAPKDTTMLEYDSYANLDVKNKWVMVFRYVPEGVSAERRQYLQHYARLEYKAAVAKDLGAKGIIFVSGPTSNTKDDLISFKRVTGTDIGIAALSLSNEMAEQILSLQQKSLAQLQKDLDVEMPIAGFEVNRIQLSAKVDIRIISGDGHNTIGLLKAPGAKHTLIIGAHGDHLGDEPSDSSLRSSTDADPIHYGADDNASGVSAVLELAHYFKRLSQEKKLKQNIIFAVWSGEEIGNLGSTHFARELKKLNIEPSAYINMDMIGRWRISKETNQYEPLMIQGIGSSPSWKKMIESIDITQPISLQDDPYLPTDSMSFYLAKIPTINFFTGAHPEYHTPRDTEEKINYAGLEEITQIISRLAFQIAGQDQALPYYDIPRVKSEARRGFRIFLGTIPDYTEDKIKGVKLSGVITGGPADRAGLKTGDVIIEFSRKKIESIHDYVFTLETTRANEPTSIVVLREGKRQEITITPTAKE